MWKIFFSGETIGDKIEDMIKIYGDKYEKNGETYKYKKDGSILSILTKNGKISVIKYTL